MSHVEVVISVTCAAQNPQSEVTKLHPGPNGLDPSLVTYFYQRVQCKHCKMAEKLLSGAHQVKIGNYLLGDTLGSGTFGKVKGNY